MTTAVKALFALLHAIIFLNSNLYAADCSTIADNTWDCGTPAPNDNLSVNHTVTINGDFDLTGNITVNNGGHLIINGGMAASVSDIYVYNGGTLIIQGSVDLSANCNFIVEGYAVLNQTLIVQNSSLVRISGSILVQGFVTIDGGGTLDIEPDGVFDTNSDFLANSNLNNIDGALNIVGSFTNNKSITGSGQITYTNECLGTGTVNGSSSADYCGTGTIDLNNFDCSVTDTVNPVFDTFPVDQNLYLTAGNCGVAANWILPTVSDNCGIQDMVSTANPGDMFPLGESTVIYTVTDIAGNSLQQSFVINVSDTISPEFISFPSDLTALVDETSCSASVNWNTPEVTDNCNSVTISSTHDSGDLFPIGNTEVIYTVTDSSGNSTQKSFTVTIQDNTPPVFKSYPDDIFIDAEMNTCTAQVSWNEPETAPDCGEISISSNFQSGFTFPIGETEVIYTIADTSGNSTSQSFIVTVKDVSPPKFDLCPSSYSILSTNSIDNTSEVIWDEPVVTDDCSIVTISSNYLPGDKFSPGITEVVYKATDNASNSATCSFNVKIDINLPPFAENITKYIKAGESIDICLSASDPNGDKVIIKEIIHDNSLNTLSDIDTEALCFLYSADIAFYGEDTVIVILEDNVADPKTSRISVFLEVEQNIDIEIYDVLSINGDMINDSWLIKNIDQYPNNSVSVFDRSGGLVFKCSGYNNNSIVWSGESNSGFLNAGGFVSTGTYFYAIDLGNGSKMLTGAIEVVR